MKGMAGKTIALAMMTFVCVSQVNAADWKHLGSDGKGNHYFFKPKTYAMSKDRIASSWTKVEYKVDEAAMAKKKLAPDNYTGVSSTIVYAQYNCVDKKKKSVVGKHYEGNDDNDVQRTGWLTIQPGSTDEGLLTALCKENIAPKEAPRTPGKK